MIPSLASLGFGYLTVGTVTAHPRPGNPKPRLFRNAGESSFINAMGFPSKGLVPAARQLELYRSAGSSVPIVVSVSGVTVEEIVRCHRRLEALPTRWRSTSAHRTRRGCGCSMNLTRSQSYSVPSTRRGIDR